MEKSAQLKVFEEWISWPGDECVLLDKVMSVFVRGLREGHATLVLTGERASYVPVMLELVERVARVSGVKIQITRAYRSSSTAFHFTVDRRLEESPQAELERRLRIRLDELDLSARSYNCLVRRAGIETVGELVQCSPDGLRKIKNFGRLSLLEVTRLLRAMGLLLPTNIQELGIDRASVGRVDFVPRS